MAEYIEREALIYDFEHCGADSATINAIVYRINLHKAADVVHVVCCRDCKHITPVEGGLPLCTLHNIARAYNDFCSDGARMDGE